MWVEFRCMKYAWVIGREVGWIICAAEGTNGVKLVLSIAMYLKMLLLYFAPTTLAFYS